MNNRTLQLTRRYGRIRPRPTVQLFICFEPDVTDQRTMGEEQHLRLVVSR